MNKERILRTIIQAFFFFAITHSAILVILAITRSDLTFLNLFNIYDLEKFFPGIDQGLPSFLIGGILMAIVFVISYTLADKKKK